FHLDDEGAQAGQGGHAGQRRAQRRFAHSPLASDDEDAGLLTEPCGIHVKRRLLIALYAPAALALAVGPAAAGSDVARAGALEPGLAAGPTTPSPSPAPAPSGHIDVIEVAGLVDRVVADFLERSLRSAETGGAEALVLQLDSAGAVVPQSELDDLVARISRSRTPVAVWVGPSGARAYGGARASSPWCRSDSASSGCGPASCTPPPARRWPSSSSSPGASSSCSSSSPRGSEWPRRQELAAWSWHPWVWPTFPPGPGPWSWWWSGVWDSRSTFRRERPACGRASAPP